MKKLKKDLKHITKMLETFYQVGLLLKNYDNSKYNLYNSKNKFIF